MRSYLQVLLALLIAAFAFRASAQAPAAPPAAPALPAPKTKILVTPFEYAAAANSHTAFAFVVPAHIAERLEADPALEPLNGELVLTEAQARLVTPKGANYDLAAANRLARAKGARYFLTGKYTGQTWTFRVEAFLYEVGTAAPTLVGSGSAYGDINDDIVLDLWDGSTRKVHTLAADRLFGFAGAAVKEAFAKANVPLADATAAAIAKRPSRSPDAFAALLLGRAYVRYFFGGAVSNSVDEDDTSDLPGTVGKGAVPGLGAAFVARQNDPKHPEAERFYAALQERSGNPKRARFHYEFALVEKPNDVRSLVQLGKIEMSMDNPDLAAGYLKRAVTVRAEDGDPFYWYGVALLRLAKTDEGIRALETARSLQPLHGAARKELALQYSLRKQYVEAAFEFAALARDIEPGNVDMTFLMAACLRAGGDPQQAGRVLGEARARFASESRLPKFRGDLLMAAGSVADARVEYLEALRLAPNDARLKSILDANSQLPMPLGGAALLQATVNAVADAAKTEKLRAESQRSVNVAVADLHDNGEKACVDGRAPSFAKLAQRLSAEHHKTGFGISVTANGIAQALKNGEAAVYTPDEALDAQRVLKAAKVGERDVREMDAHFRRVFLPLFERNGCGEYDGPVTEATVEQVTARNADRQVVMPPYKPPVSVMSFTPQIDPQQARRIRFTVDNLKGELDKEVTLDGTLLGTVGAGESDSFETSVGNHVLCVVPAGQPCGPTSTLRAPFLRDGWTIKTHVKD